MTPEKLREIAAEIMRHKSTVAVEGVVPQWLHDQLLAHAAALEEIERLKGELTAMTTERNSYKINASVYKGDSENAEAALAAQSVKLKADEIAWHEQEEAIRDLRAERDALKRHAEDVKRDLAASVVKSAELEEENSKLRSALAIVHFKREPWQ